MFASSKDKDERVSFELKDLAKDYEVGFDAAVIVLGYLYSGKVRSLPKEACACADDDCSHTTCRPALDFKLQVLYVSLTFQVYELVAFYEVCIHIFISSLSVFVKLSGIFFLNFLYRIIQRP